jgi:hypothetical protein
MNAAYQNKFFVIGFLISLAVVGFLVGLAESCLVEGLAEVGLMEGLPDVGPDVVGAGLGGSSWVQTSSGRGSEGPPPCIRCQGNPRKPDRPRGSSCTDLLYPRTPIHHTSQICLSFVERSGQNSSSHRIVGVVLLTLSAVTEWRVPLRLACDNILNGYLCVVATVFIQQDGIYGFKFPKRFLEISSQEISLFSQLFSRS